MPSSVKLNKAGDLIEIQSYGVVTKEHIAESIARVKELNKKSAISIILVDTSKQEKLPDAFELIKLANTFPTQMKVALLITESQPTKDGIHFVETANLNRGVDVKYFTDKQQAVQWLRNN
jgi:hypothetical protein